MRCHADIVHINSERPGAACISGGIIPGQEHETTSLNTLTSTEATIRAFTPRVAIQAHPVLVYQREPSRHRAQQEVSVTTTIDRSEQVYLETRGPLLNSRPDRVAQPITNFVLSSAMPPELFRLEVQYRKTLFQVHPLPSTRSTAIRECTAGQACPCLSLPGCGRTRTVFAETAPPGLI
ncbi:hypothetical protein BGZ60DRAFT_153783 [Tricladium varicosporioides]|nr:hypothetical protein BGZ60DRAFT_153783 [Hymenoscyphus varicosporioides]